VGVGLADDLIGAADDFTADDDGFTGTADDLEGTGVLDVFADVGLATDDDTAEEVGLPAADDDLLLPPPDEAPRARILAAACSATTTMYDVGLVVIMLYNVSGGRKEAKEVATYPGKREASTTWMLSVP
jgi:hypothetical protein